MHDRDKKDVDVITADADVAEDNAGVLRVIEIPNSKRLRQFRSVAFQMVIFGALSVCGPSMVNGESPSCFMGFEVIDGQPYRRWEVEVRPPRILPMLHRLPNTRSLRSARE